MLSGMHEHDLKYGSTILKFGGIPSVSKNQRKKLMK